MPCSRTGRCSPWRSGRTPTAADCRACAGSASSSPPGRIARGPGHGRGIIVPPPIVPVPSSSPPAAGACFTSRHGTLCRRRNRCTKISHTYLSDSSGVLGLVLKNAPTTCSVRLQQHLEKYQQTARIKSNLPTTEESIEQPTPRRRTGAPACDKKAPEESWPATEHRRTERRTRPSVPPRS